MINITFPQVDSLSASHFDMDFQRPSWFHGRRIKEPVRQFCSKCSDNYSQAPKDSREAIWSDLPKVYGIARSWAELYKGLREQCRLLQLFRRLLPRQIKMVELSLSAY